MSIRYPIFFILFSAYLITRPATLSSAPLPIWEMNFQEVRDLINQGIMKIEALPTPVFSIQDQTIVKNKRSTLLRIYTPLSAAENLPLILFIHGGAWVAGSIDTHDNLARYLAAGSNAIVVSVDYGISPEHKFPYPLEQCYDALQWLYENASTLGGDKSRLAIAGDSAGGNMAAALCLMARDRQGPAIALQVLINPAPDLSGKGTLERQNDPVDIMRWQALQYLFIPAEASHPYASPLLAPDLSNLPPALVLVAENDYLLKEDGQKFGEKLLAAGVPCEIYCQKGIGHLAGHGARAATEARESLDVAVAAIKKTFAPTLS